MSHVAVVVGLVASLMGVPATAPEVKSATATCPPGEFRFAGGGAVEHGPDGGGGVALTGIVPDAAGDSITVTAAGPAGPWSVDAFVTCSAFSPPDRVVVPGVGTATAECRSPFRLYGLGFQAAGPVTEVSMNAGLSRARVTAGDGVEVAAIALCRPPAGHMQRVRATSTTPGWPKKASGLDTDPDTAVYATGATVTGPPGAAIDAIVPGPDNGLTWARATLMGVPGQQRGDGDGSVMVESARIGTFH